MVDDTVAQERRDFYVYVIFRPRGTPCYVGKGRGNRWRMHATRAHNQWLARIYEKNGGDLPIVFVRRNMTNADALETERALIQAIGRADKGPLVNMTDGGEGTIGYEHKEETIYKIAAFHTGRKRSVEMPPKARGSSGRAAGRF